MWQTFAWAQTKPQPYNQKQLEQCLKTCESLHRAHPESLYHYIKKALPIAQKLNNTEALADLYKYLGTYYKQLGEFSKALKYQMNALKYYQKSENTRGVAAALGNIGIIYRKLKEQKLAFDYQFKALHLMQKIGDLRLVANTYNNIGLLHLDQQQHHKALVFFQKTLDLDIQHKDAFGIASDYSNLSKVWSNLNKHKKAIVYEHKSLKIRLEQKNKHGVMISYKNLGEYHHAIKQDSIAIIYLKKALRLAHSIQALDFKVETYRTLSNIYENQKKHIKALAYHKKYTLAADSLLNAQKEKEIVRLQTLYNIEKQNKENKLLKQQREIDKLAISTQQDAIIKQRYFISITSIALAFTLALTYFIFRLFQQKRKNHTKLQQLYEEIQSQNEEIVAQRDQISTQHEELASKNYLITQSIKSACNIQQAALPKLEFVKTLFPQHFIIYKPKDVVSGDFYWIDQLDNKYQFLVAIDCTGHGVPGAFVSMIANALLDRIIKVKKVTEPANILNELNQKVNILLNQDDERAGVGMDMVICRIKPNSLGLHEICVAGARLDLYYAQPNANIEIVKGLRKSIGGFYNKKVQFTQQFIYLPKGSMIYLSSDGFTDQNDVNRHKFGKLRFIDLLSKIHEDSLIEQKKCLHTQLNLHMQNTTQRDDILVMGFRLSHTTNHQF